MGDAHTLLHAGLGGAGLARLRARFPVLAQSIRGAPLAYLDNAATTQLPLAVQRAMRHFEQHDRANIHRGAHTLSQRATDAFEQARSTLKRFVGAGAAHELIFTSGTTDALNLVAHGLSTPGARPAFIQPGDEIVVSGLEHHANLVPWQQAARRVGARLRILMPDAKGRLHVADLARLLTPRTRVFAVTACANATGERPPFEALLALAAGAGALTVLDAAQSVAHAVPDLSALACDFMAFSGHKMLGPMGTGALVGRRTALERLEPLRYGGDMVAWVSATEASFAGLPMRLEGGTPNVAGAVGLAAAADFIDRTGRGAIDAHVGALRAHAATGLAAIARRDRVVTAKHARIRDRRLRGRGRAPARHRHAARRAGHRRAHRPPLRAAAARAPGPGADHARLVRALQHACGSRAAAGRRGACAEGAAMNAQTAAELDLYQDVVMDHKRAPRHFGTLAAPTHHARGRNPSCGDDLQVTLQVAQERIEDIRFSGQGCAICIASASMMTEAVHGGDVALAHVSCSSAFAPCSPASSNPRRRTWASWSAWPACAAIRAASNARCWAGTH